MKTKFFSPIVAAALGSLLLYVLHRCSKSDALVLPNFLHHNRVRYLELTCDKIDASEIKNALKSCQAGEDDPIALHISIDLVSRLTDGEFGKFHEAPAEIKARRDRKAAKLLGKLRWYDIYLSTTIGLHNTLVAIPKKAIVHPEEPAHGQVVILRGKQ